MSEFINVFFKGKRNMPPKAQSVLDNIGDNTILEIKIYRTPLNNNITFLGNLVTNNKLNERMKEIEYDDLYHLYMIIRMSNGKNLLVEKNEVINISLNIPKTSNKTEMMEITDIPNELTINTFINNTRNFMGEKKFYLYDAFNNNCQYFIIGLLKANKMGNETIFNFAKQDIKFLFK